MTTTLRGPQCAPQDAAPPPNQVRDKSVARPARPSDGSTAYGAWVAGEGETDEYALIAENNATETIGYQLEYWTHCDAPTAASTVQTNADSRVVE